jgi:recombination protein RecA
MSTPHGDVDAALAGLQARWGAAAPRVLGALALAPAAAPAPDGTAPAPAALPDERVIRTGFPALDAILGPGGLPRSASVAIRGDGSSGRTTLALRVAAEAQAAGSVVAWLDLSRSFDPVEAVTRGIRLEWLVVITPQSLDEGLSIAGSLLAGRSIDLLVLDLPGGRLARTDTPARIADRLHRLAALARRAETLLLVLDAPGLGGGLATAVDQSTGIRLELARRSWVRLGRDIVGQQTEALVAHDRYGPPGRTATLRILYAEGGERDACLTRDALLLDEGRHVVDVHSMHRMPTAVHPVHATAPPVPRPVPLVHPVHETTPDDPASVRSVHPMHGSSTGADSDASPMDVRCTPCTPATEPTARTALVPTALVPTAAAPPVPIHAPEPEAPDRETDHATPASLRAAPPPGPGSGPPLRALSGGAARAGRPAVGPGPRHRRQRGRPDPRRPARDAARQRPSTRP